MVKTVVSFEEWLVYKYPSWKEDMDLLEALMSPTIKARLVVEYHAHCVSVYARLRQEVK